MRAVSQVLGSSSVTRRGATFLSGQRAAFAPRNSYSTVTLLNSWNGGQSQKMASANTLRAFSSSAAATPPALKDKAPSKPDMFCFQCEQTEHGSGCTVVGVCGKTPEVAELQDLLVEQCKGISQYAKRARELGESNADVDRFVLKALFSTMTNVNFDPEAMVAYIKEAGEKRDMAKSMYETACRKAGQVPSVLKGPAALNVNGKTKAQLQAMGSQLGVLERKAERDADVAGIQEMTLYGVKGLCAYADHACILGKESDEVYQGIHEILDALVNPTASMQEALAVSLKAGAVNLKVMEILDDANTSAFGHPTPHNVPCVPKLGKAILVSGHDLHDLHHILEQTKGTGINVYTHGEMLPAHGYPILRSYAHLAGHYGGPWQLQKMEFSAFPGPIVMTSNCIIEPRRSYKNRIFTRQVTGWPGVVHLDSNDYSKVIASALAADGFTQEDVSVKPTFLTTGFARTTVLNIAGTIVDAVKNGTISRFFVIGGCDGSEGERNYFKELALATPRDSIILTLGCGKYRLNKLGLGNLPGTELPRVLDMGQCNDAYSAITVAVALAKAFKTDVNSLPLSFAVSWFEQKAVAVLLTLLHLGIKNIRLGPNLPGFATPNMLQFLNSHFQLHKTDTVGADLQQMLASR